MSEWSQVTIGECCEILDNQRIPVNGEERSQRIGTIPYYGANGLQGFIDDYIFNEPLILMAEDGGNFDEFATRPIAYCISGKSWVNNHAHVLRSAQGYDQPFVFYCLEHKDVTPFIKGGTRAKLNQFELRQVTIPSPSLPEQKKIARILTTVDNLIEKTEALIEKYKSIKQGMMHDLFTRGVDQNGKLRPPYEEAPQLYKESPLGWIPKEWETPEISSILARRPKNGYSPKESNEWTSVLMLGLGCLTLSGFEPIQLKNAPKNDPNVAYALLRDGDLLMSRSNTRELVALVGRYRDVGYPCIYSDLMMRLVPIDAILPDYMEAILRHAPVRRQLTNASCGTSGSMMKINSQMVLNTIIPLPIKNEQQELLDRVTSVSSLVQQSRKELEKYMKVKSGLMQDLLTGKVRVKVDETEED